METTSQQSDPLVPQPDAVPWPDPIPGQDTPAPGPDYVPGQGIPELTPAYPQPEIPAPSPRSDRRPSAISEN